MAASVQLYTVGEFKAERLALAARMQKAVDGNEYYLRRLDKQPHFNFRSTTDTNTAAGSSNIAFNLSSNGLRAANGSMLANEARDILIDVVAANGANRYRWSQMQRVGLSSSDPVLIGGKVFLTDCFARYGMTTADGSATTEVAAECLGPAWWDGAAPAAAAISSNTLTITWLGGNSPVGVLIPGSCEYTDAAAAAADARSLQHGAVSLTNGTSAVFISDVATPTAATFANASAVRATAFITPPVSVELTINSTPTPDEMIISLVGLSSDVVTWDVSVTIGDPIYLPLV